MFKNDRNLFVFLSLTFDQSFFLCTRVCTSVMMYVCVCARERDRQTERERDDNQTNMETRTKQMCMCVLERSCVWEYQRQGET